MEQALYDLPDGWEWKAIHEVAQIGVEKGYTPSPTDDGFVPFIGMSNVDQRTGFNSTYEWREISSVKNGYTKFQKDAILLAKITPCTENNKTALIDFLNGGYATTEVYPIHPKKELLPKFILYFFRSTEIRKLLIDSMEGATGRQRVPLKTVKAIIIPVCSIPEQQRIVTKLDALLSRIDKAIELLWECLTLMGNTYSAALEEAFNPLNAPKSSQDGKYDLPDGWEWKTIEDVSSKVQYGFTAKASTKGNAKLLRITDIQDGKINWDLVPFASLDEKELKKYLLNNNELVFARSGATAGKSILTKDIPSNAIFASYLIRIVPRSDVIHPEYLALFFLSPMYWAAISNNVAGAAQPNVNGTKLSALAVPRPLLLAKQEHIAEKLDTLTTKHQQSKDGMTAQITHLEQLKASILDAAFKGQL